LGTKNVDTTYIMLYIKSFEVSNVYITFFKSLPLLVYQPAGQWRICMCVIYLIFIYNVNTWRQRISIRFATITRRSVCEHNNIINANFPTLSHTHTHVTISLRRSADNDFCIAEVLRVLYKCAHAHWLHRVYVYGLTGCIPTFYTLKLHLKIL